MKWLDRIFKKIWWSTHPREEAFMRGALLEARLEYPRQVTRCLIELTEFMDPPSPERDAKIRGYRKLLWDIEAKVYGLEVRS